MWGPRSEQYASLSLAHGSLATGTYVYASVYKQVGLLHSLQLVRETKRYLPYAWLIQCRAFYTLVLSFPALIIDDWVLVLHDRKHLCIEFIRRHVISVLAVSSFWQTLTSSTWAGCSMIRLERLEWLVSMFWSRSILTQTLHLTLSYSQKNSRLARPVCFKITHTLAIKKCAGSYYCEEKVFDIPPPSRKKNPVLIPVFCLFTCSLVCCRCVWT